MKVFMAKLLNITKADADKTNDLIVIFFYLGTPLTLTFHRWNNTVY